MYIVEVMPNLYFHYFVKGEMILGHKKFAKRLSLCEIEKLKLTGYKVEEI